MGFGFGFFFFNDTATTEIYTLSLHDALPIWVGIVHLGVGNFHRAHQACYINEYLNNYDDLNWGIVGVNLRKSESENFQHLKNREGKYILKTISTAGEKKYSEIHSKIGRAHV